MAYTIRPDGDTSYKVFKDGAKQCTLSARQVHEAVREMGDQVISMPTFNHLLDGHRKADRIRKLAEADPNNLLAHAIIHTLDNA